MRLTGFKKTVRVTLDRKAAGSVKQVVAMAAFNLAVFAAREVFNHVVYGDK